MISVLSSSIAAVGYDGSERVLFVRFREGMRLYRYRGVPLPTFQALLEAPSKGRFLAGEIRDRYPYERVA